MLFSPSPMLWSRSYSALHSLSLKLSYPECSRSRQFPIHLDPPSRSEPSHGPDDATACDGDDTNTGKKPAVADGGNERLGHNRTDARKNVADAVVKRHPGGRVGRHEFCQHGGDHAKDEHAANAEEKVGDELESEVSGCFDQRGCEKVGIESCKRRRGRELTGTAQNTVLSDVQPYQMSAAG